MRRHSEMHDCIKHAIAYMLSLTATGTTNKVDSTQCFSLETAFITDFFAGLFVVFKTEINVLMTQMLALLQMNNGGFE